MHFYTHTQYTFYKLHTVHVIKDLFRKQQFIELMNVQFILAKTIYTYTHTHAFLILYNIHADILLINEPHKTSGTRSDFSTQMY